MPLRFPKSGLAPAVLALLLFAFGGSARAEHWLDACLRFARLAPKRAKIAEPPRRADLPYEHYLQRFHTSFHTRFHEKVGELDEKSHWIAVDCGTCRAPRAVLALHGWSAGPVVHDVPSRQATSPRITGITEISDFDSLARATSPEDFAALGRARSRFPQSIFRFHPGTRIEEVKDPVRRFEQANLLTDPDGYFARAADPAKVLERYGELLKPQGTAFLAFDPKKEFVIFNAKGERLLPLEYFREIRGLDVHSEYGLVVLTRNREALRVPRLEPLAGGGFRCAECAPLAAPAALDRRKIRQNLYDFARDKKEYVKNLTRKNPAGENEFQRLLEKLGEKDLWVDIGCGTCSAAIDHFEELGVSFGNPVSSVNLKGTPRFAGVNVSDDFTAESQGAIGKPKHNAEQVARYREFEANAPKDRIRVHTGQAIEDIAEPERTIGLAKLLTDVWSAFAYSPRLDEVFAKYGRMLALGGKALIYVPKGHTLRFVDEAGREVTLQTFLSLCKGFRADYDGETIILTRVAGDIVVPRLKLLQFQEGTPPKRVFKIVGL